MSLATVNLDGVPEEYHDFTDVFSKSKARVLADHSPYNLKITLEEGASPLGPIYSLSQEELLILRKFIDENTATRFHLALTVSPQSTRTLHMEEGWLIAPLLRLGNSIDPSTLEGFLPLPLGVGVRVGM